MDDELSAARRRGAVRKLLWPHGIKHKGFMHGRRWAGAALVLLICALTVVGIAVFNGSGKAQPPQESKGSEGVLALGDFFSTYEDRIDFQTAGTVRDLTRRLMNEPFEVSAQMTIESEALKSFGIPLTSVPAQMDIKYDLRDAGVKVSAAGLSLFEAYLAENEASAVWIGAEPAAAELSAAEDVSGDMTLENRIGAFMPLPPEGLLDRLLAVLAQSVPVDCTEQQLGRAYSPKDNKDVNVTLVCTALDDKTLSAVASAFAEQLKKDEALYGEARQFTAQVAALCGVKDLTLDALLAQLTDKDDVNTKVSWKVYRRDEIPVGFAISVTTRDTQLDFTRIAEFDGETSCEYTQMLVNGTEVFSADTVTMDNSGEFSLKVLKAPGEPVSIKGTFDLEPITENSYHLIADAVADGRLLSEEGDTAHFVIDARIDVGNSLGMMAGSPDWKGIKE